MEWRCLHNTPISSSQLSYTSASQSNAFIVASSICDDTSAVRRFNQTQHAGIGRGRGRGIGSARCRPLQTSFAASTGAGDGPAATSVIGVATSVPREEFSGLKRGRGSSKASGAQKRPSNVSFGLYTDHRTGSQVLNPGTQSKRLVLDGRNLKNVAATNIDIGFKSRGLKWKGKNATTFSQLQNMSIVKKYSAATSTSSSRMSTDK